MQGGQMPRRRAADWAIALEALVALLAARAVLPRVAFRHLSRALGLTQRETSLELDEAAEATARRVRWALAAAEKRLPADSTCLAQGLAATAMLRRRRIAATLYLGVAPGVTRGTTDVAHAWVRAGRSIVTGASGRERFAVIASLAAPPRA